MFGLLRKPSRLGRWDGRKRSSRGDDLMWANLWQRDVLLRIGLVGLTTVAVTLLVFFWGVPFTYRIGEVFPYDIRPRVDFEMINKVELSKQSAPNRETNSGLPPGNTGIEGVLRETTRLSEPQPLEKYTSDMVIVQRNTPISERQLAVLREEHRAYVASLSLWDHVRRGLSLFLVYSLIATLMGLYVARFQPELARHWRTLISVCVLILITAALGLLGSQAPWDALFLPLAIAAMILTLAYNQQSALIVSITLSLILILALRADMTNLLVLLSGLCALILLLRNVRSRTQLVKVSCAAGVIFFLATFVVGLMTGQSWNLILSDATRRFIWGTLAGFLLTGLLPVVERIFGIVTDISLREYADGSHPLLQELVRRAPGTYTHSITVATLAEAAAEAINANPLLVRVGSYFHDVGKMLKPQYFIENQSGENRHDSLEPALSTLIIIGHVKDGIALAKQYNLPRPILDFIEQHHGTTLVEYFYREALRLQGVNGQNGSSTNGEMEASFRYPGPKPQSRESGVLMLADAVESASRCLVDPTPTRIRKLVHDILMKRLLDGQFEESGLTLSELHIIEEALNKSLIALFHARIKYEEEEKTDVQVKAS